MNYVEHLNQQKVAAIRVYGRERYLAADVNIPRVSYQMATEFLDFWAREIGRQIEGGIDLSGFSLTDLPFGLPISDPIEARREACKLALKTAADGGQDDAINALDKCQFFDVTFRSVVRALSVEFPDAIRMLDHPPGRRSEHGHYLLGNLFAGQFWEALDSVAVNMDVLGAFVAVPERTFGDEFIDNWQNNVKPWLVDRVNDAGAVAGEIANTIGRSIGSGVSGFLSTAGIPILVAMGAVGWWVLR